MRKSMSGFTIVELLIVIVVIAILAAISTVAFSGIQTRAENLKTTSAVSEYAKALQLYRIDQGTYPVASWSCLGTHPGTNCAATPAGTPTCDGNGSVSSTAGFDTEMSKVFSGGSKPRPSTQWVNCGGTNYGGAYYWSSDGVSVTLRYFLKGNQVCPTIGNLNNVGRFQLNDATLCYTTPPA